MPVNQIPRKRNGVEEIHTVGTHEDGNVRNYSVSTLPQPNGLKYRKRPLRMIIDFGEDGELLEIFNMWLVRDLTPTGDFVPDQKARPFNFESSKEAKETFVQRFGSIPYSMINGLNSAEGFHELEVINSKTGAVNQFTEQQMNQPPVTDRNDPHHYLYLPPTEADEDIINP